MIELRDTVMIDVPPRAVWEWLETMPDHILEWHPDHSDSRRVYRGGSWGNSSGSLRVGYWSNCRPFAEGGFLGFRFCRTR